MSWQTATLGQLCDEFGGFVQTGPFGSQLKQSEYVDDPNGIPVVMPKDIKDGRIDLHTAARITEEKALTLSRHFLADGDIIFPRRGDINKLAIVEDGAAIFCGTGCLRIHTPKATVVPKFLFYFLGQPKIAEWLEARAIGSTMLNLNTSIMRAVEIKFPDYAAQERIASALSAYDDLVENNRRRIALLEEAARQLYKEWFVRFRFPGHEHVKIIDGVPEGWERCTISQLGTVGRGGSPRPIQDFLGGDVPWFKIGDATASESPFIFETAESIIEKGVSRSVLLDVGELILSNSATCGVPNFTAVKGCIHDGWLHFRGLQSISKGHLYFYMIEARERLLQGIGEGATQKNLNTDYVGRQIIVFPASGAVLEQFEDFAEISLTSIELLARQNLALRRARDLLLPRLMSGSLAA